MSIQVLFELAHLDVLGLLDDAEREAFERSFAEAPPAVQAQVRREQARVARAMADDLPDVAASSGLRSRVIASVERAYGVESAVAHAAGREDPVPPRGRRVSRLWRAAALGFATAATVLGVLFVHLTTQYQSLHERVASDALVSQLVSTYGSAYVYDTLFDPETERVVFSPASTGFQGKASLLVNPEWDRAKLFCHALPAKADGTPASERYHLAVIDEAGNIVEVLSSFDSQGTLLAKDVSLAAGLVPRLAILPSKSDGGYGTPVLATSR